jgi:hypothetical protein
MHEQRIAATGFVQQQLEARFAKQAKAHSILAASASRRCCCCVCARALCPKLHCCLPVLIKPLLLPLLLLLSAYLCHAVVGAPTPPCCEM